MSTQFVTRVEAPSLPQTARLADYAQLVRPKIAIMVVVTAGLGMMLTGAPVDVATVVLTLLGTTLVTAGASAGNQLAERRADGRMRRTENRPLPAGRLSVSEVLAFTVVTTISGLVCLTALASGPAAALVAGASFVLYVFVYTPAKRHTWLNTFIGAIPGALPPLIGWASVRGSLTLESLPLFGILFFWQVPHFMAIAWMYRDDYRRAGLQMLPVLDPSGRRTARTMILHSLILLVVSMTPMVFGAGSLYGLGAAALGLVFLGLAVKFRSEKTVESARAVLKMSLAYLPGVLLILVLDRFM